MGANVIVQPIPKRLAADIVRERHYLHRRPTISWAFGLMPDDDLWPVAVVTFGSPASAQVCIGACPDEPSAVTELNRLWIDDGQAHGTASAFVGRAMRQMPPRIVVSYADLSFGHVGYVYRAMSWHYAGWTDMERRTPRLDYVPIKAGAHTREAYRSGYAHKVRRTPKVKYWTTTGSQRERRVLSRRMRWPSLDWRTCPPPAIEAVGA